MSGPTQIFCLWSTKVAECGLRGWPLESDTCVTHHLLSVWPWASCLDPGSIRFLLCKMGVIRIPTSQGYGEHVSYASRAWAKVTAITVPHAVPITLAMSPSSLAWRLGLPDYNSSVFTWTLQMEINFLQGRKITSIKCVWMWLFFDSRPQMGFLCPMPPSSGSQWISQCFSVDGIYMLVNRK